MGESAYKPRTTRWWQDGYKIVPKLQKDAPKLQKDAPKLQKYAPRLQKVAPKLQKEAPKLQKEVQRLGGLGMMLLQKYRIVAPKI